MAVGGFAYLAVQKRIQEEKKNESSKYQMGH